MATKRTAPMDASEPIFGGGLAGILAASVFGGPVGALVGVGTGLLAERFRRNEIDMEADAQEGLQTFANHTREKISQALPYADEFGDPSGSDHSQLDDIAGRMQRGQEMAAHSDPTLRAAGVAEMQAASQMLTDWHSGMEARTQHLADQKHAEAQEQAIHFRTFVEAKQEQAVSLNALADQAMYLINNNGVENVETKSKLMQLLGMGPREADQDTKSLSAGIPFVGQVSGIDFDDFSPSYDEAVKMVESVRTTQLKAIQESVALATKQYIDSGLPQINTVIEQFKQAQPSAQVQSAIATERKTPPKTVGDAAANAVNRVIHPASDGTGNGGTELDALGSYFGEKINEAQKFMNENLRRKAPASRPASANRPVN